MPETLKPAAWDLAVAQIIERALSRSWLGIRDASLARLMILVNHITMQEPEAMRRLQLHKGKAVHIAWRSLVLRLRISGAGLWVLQGLDTLSAQQTQEGVTASSADTAGNTADTAPDLSIRLDATPVQALQQGFKGQEPSIQIAGNVQLAAEINWLAQNLRWDIEEDLARFIGDAPAHSLVHRARAWRARLSEWLANSPLTQSHTTKTAFAVQPSVAL